MRQKTNSYCVFKHINKDCCRDGKVDYAHIAVSQGSVPRMHIAHAAVDDNGVLSVRFDGRGYGGDARDELFLFVFCPEWEVGHLVEPTTRADASVTVALPEEWKGLPLHLYSFLRDRRGRTSTTDYRALPSGDGEATL